MNHVDLRAVLEQNSDMAHLAIWEALETAIARLDEAERENSWAVNFTCPTCGPTSPAMVKTSKVCLICGDGLIRSKHPALVRLEQEAKARERDVLSLTPGGSEFVSSWDNCIGFIQERMRVAGKVAAERNRLRKTLEERDRLGDEAKQLVLDKQFMTDWDEWQNRVYKFLKRLAATQSEQEDISDESD